MEEELIEILDETGANTGIIKYKSEIKEKGLFHRGISVCVLNTNNEILMHQRSNLKKVYPNLWSCFVRGHVKAHESSVDSCIREIEEELGIKVTANNINFLYTSKSIEQNPNTSYINNIFFDNYITIHDIKIKDLRLQVDEVSEVKFINYKDLEELIKSNDESLIPNFEDYKEIISLLENMKKLNSI